MKNWRLTLNWKKECLILSVSSRLNQGVWIERMKEEAVIGHLRELGKELLTEWGTGKESQKFNEAHGSHPESSVKKKDLLGDHLWGCSP